MKKVLVLGGTNFIGRNLVEQLIASKQYEITLFNRGKSGRDFFPEVKTLVGDRDTEAIQQIAKHSWDFVIDLSCYYPSSLQKSLAALDHIERYIFISTCSVYHTELNSKGPHSENHKIHDCSEEQKTDSSPEAYGPRKAECERILRKSGLPHSILRPALVYGPYDPTDRMYYWLYQVQMKKTLLLPENGEGLFSSTYVLDLVQAIFRVLEFENQPASLYNVITAPRTSIKQIVRFAASALQKKPTVRNASAAFLKEEGISEWIDMPLWIHGDHLTFSNQTICDKLDFQATDFEQSIADTIPFFENSGWPKPNYGISDDELERLLKLSVKIKAVPIKIETAS